MPGMGGRRNRHAVKLVPPCQPSAQTLRPIEVPVKNLHCLSPAAALLAALIATTPAFAQTVVPAAPFRAVKLEGGGHVVIRRGAVQQVRLLHGSTAFTRFSVDRDEPDTLHIYACNNDCPRHYDLEIEITTPDIEALAVAGGGSIDGDASLSGLHALTLAVDGGGTIDTRAMDSGAVTAAVRGGGFIKLRARNALTAAVEGGGRIRYWGSPRVTQAVEGGGRVDRGD
jgi:hypothetical protein